MILALPGRFRSIGARLAVAYATGTTLTITLMLLLGYKLLEARLVAGLDLLNRSEFQEIQSHLGHDYANLTPAIVEQRVRETTEEASVLFYINIQGREARGLFRSSNLGSANIPDVPGLQTFDVSMAGIGDLRVGEFVLQPFDVEVATPLAEVRALMHGYVEVSLGLIGLLLVASAAIGLSLSRLILRPLRVIQETATRIGSDTLGERVPVGHVRDELSDLARLLNQMFDRLESAFSEVRRFAAEASHELKTSLSLVRLHTEKLMVAEDLTPAQQDAVHDQLDELGRLNRIIDGLLFLSRAESNAVACDAQPQDVPAFLAGFQVDALALAEHRGCSFACVHHGHALAAFDAGLLRRVLLNLLSNALNASPPHGHIALTSTVEDETWRVSVEDDGLGLPPAQQESVFGRFVRFSPSPLLDGGSGLGLPICRTILQLHRGRIFVESREGRAGLRAVFEIPQPPCHDGQI